jgi:hypothetical protein
MVRDCRDDLEEKPVNAIDCLGSATFDCETVAVSNSLGAELVRRR